MSTGTGTRILRAFIEEVWTTGDLAALDRFWTADCVNHAAPPEHAVGIAALGGYHESFAASFTAFLDLQTEVVQQVEEDDQVVTQLVTSGQQFGRLCWGRCPGQTRRPGHHPHRPTPGRQDRGALVGGGRRWSASAAAGLTLAG